MTETNSRADMHSPLTALDVFLLPCGQTVLSVEAKAGTLQTDGQTDRQTDRQTGWTVACKPGCAVLLFTLDAAAAEHQGDM